MEHVTRHLLYSRFWHQFLYDIQEVNTPEPYQKRTYQGLILGPDGDKMSKSKGNVVDPIDVIDRYGADTLRTYVMFMGDYTAATPWSEQSANGCKRFLDRVWRLQDMIEGQGESKDMRSKAHGCVKKVTDDIEHMKFNTAIAAMMSLVNDFYSKGTITRDELHTLLMLLNPFAPHLTEEINETMGYEQPLYRTPWPTYEESALVADTVEYGIQVNGKVRARISLPADLDKTAVEQAALAAEPVQPFLSGKTVRKVIVVKNIVNIVVG